MKQHYILTKRHAHLFAVTTPDNSRTSHCGLAWHTRTSTDTRDLPLCKNCQRAATVAERREQRKQAKIAAAQQDERERIARWNRAAGGGETS